jgi:hypothetical protein
MYMNRKRSLVIGVCALLVLVGIVVGASIANSRSKNDQANNSNVSHTLEPKDYSGKVVCLPKKGDGPHTLECAIGLQADDGKYYMIKESDQSQVPGRISTYPTDSRVTVTGTLTSPSDGQYDVAGAITITAIRAE